MSAKKMQPTNPTVATSEIKEADDKNSTRKTAAASSEHRTTFRSRLAFPSLENSMKHTRRSLACLAATSVAALALTGVGAGLAAAPASATGTYHTTTAVNVRTGPGTGYAAMPGGAPANTTFTLICQVQNGTSIGGNSTWDYAQLANGITGYITDYDTTTPSFNSFAPNTLGCPLQPPPSSSAAQRAANWAAAETRSARPNYSDDEHAYWSGLCQAFVWDSWKHAGVPTQRYDSAFLAYLGAVRERRIHFSGTPPVGAQVFYNRTNLNPSGHTAISLGNGQIATTYGFLGGSANTRILPFPYFPNYLGWAMPTGQ